jgi:cytochrome c553
LAILTVAAGFSAMAQAQETTVAPTTMTFEQKLASCELCHGPAGNTPTAPIYPRISGQHESYLAHALRSYRAGRRNDPIMQQQLQALDLSDAEITRLAAYFARQPGLLQINE